LLPVHEELRAKATARKAKITEHESTIAALQGQLTTAQETVREATINGPLKAMAASISLAPELWLEQFAKSHKLEMVKGQLTVLTTDGKQSIPFNRESLIAHLDADAHPQSKVFKSITIATKASGAAGVTGFPRSNQSSSTGNRPQFGLR
jgi:LPS O-antigen subunit length determinant protein (WzzB/FepE family)